MEGIVKSFSPTKGFGFIIVNGEEAFAHYSQIEMEGFKTLKVGEKVSFNLVETEKGIQANNIKIIES